MKTRKITLVLPRNHWQKAHLLIEGIMTHCGVYNLQCLERIGVKLPPEEGFVEVYTRDVGMESAILICYRLTPVYTTTLYNDQLPEPQKSLLIKQPECDADHKEEYTFALTSEHLGIDVCPDCSPIKDT